MIARNAYLFWYHKVPLFTEGTRDELSLFYLNRDDDRCHVQHINIIICAPHHIFYDRTLSCSTRSTQSIANILLHLLPCASICFEKLSSKYEVVLVLQRYKNVVFNSAVKQQ